MAVERSLLAVASAGTSVLVALLAILFSALAFRAASRRHMPSLRWVGAAFGVFAIKNAFSATNVLTHAVPHDAIELVLSLFDAALLLLLLAPLVLRRSA